MQPQFQDSLFERLQLGLQSFDLLGECDGFFGGRFAREQRVDEVHLTRLFFSVDGTGVIAEDTDTFVSEGYLIARLFILFAASMTLFAATGLVSDSIPVLAATALIVGAPLLAAGVWQERLGDLGFPLTIAGLLLVLAFWRVATAIRLVRERRSR